MYTAPILSFAALAMASAKDITAANFVTDIVAKSAPYTDLSPWGYEGGELPLVYHLNSTGAIYSPSESYALFEDIVSGTANRSSTKKLDKRIYCGKRAQLDFDLIGTNGCTTTFTGCSSPDACNSGDGCGDWHMIKVYRNNPAGYITLWKNDECGDHHASFNPTCNYDSNTATICNLNFMPNSYAVYAGCHSQYNNGACK